jgi:hypothetical protein
LVCKKYILKGRFKLGEPAIAKDAHYSYAYAIDVLHGRFPLGEPTIAKNEIRWKKYCEQFKIKQ